MPKITVFVVYDPLYEKVCSVHEQEARAIHRAVSLDDKDQRKVYYFQSSVLILIGMLLYIETLWR